MTYSYVVMGYYNNGVSIPVKTFLMESNAIRFCKECNNFRQNRSKMDASTFAEQHPAGNNFGVCDCDWYHVLHVPLGD